MAPRIELVSAGLDEAILETRRLFGKNAFRRATARGYEKQRNRAVLEAMAYYFQHDEVRDQLQGLEGDIVNTFETLCRDDTRFAYALTSTTKSVTAVFDRLTLWGTALAAIVPATSQYLP